jgi:hypothetical protein
MAAELAETEARIKDVDFDRLYSARELFLVSFAFYRRYPGLFMILALGLVASFECAALLTTGFGPLAHRGTNKVEMTLIQVFNFSLVAPLVSALYARAVLLINEGQGPTLGKVVGDSVGVLPVVIITVLVTNVAIGIGMVAFILPGVILWVRWAVVAQTAAIEEKSLLDTLRRCAQLTYGCYLHILWLLLMVGVFLVIVNSTSEALPLGDSSGLPSVAVGIVIQAFAASVTALSVAVLYFDLRARQE